MILICKKVGRNLPANYHPISFFSVVSFLYARYLQYIRSSCTGFLKKILADEQADFREGYSSLSMLQHHHPSRQCILILDVFLIYSLYQNYKRNCSSVDKRLSLCTNYMKTVGESAIQYPTTLHL